MRMSPSILMLCAAAAGLSAVANAVAPAGDPEASRMGASVAEDMSLADRAAAQRKRQLDLREQAARATEQRLQASAAAVPAKPPESEQAKADEQYDDLARIYQAMKPKSAAPVFEQLALDVQVKVAERMRERATAQIMAAMTPKAAATLTMAIARRQSTYIVLSEGSSRASADRKR